MYRAADQLRGFVYKGDHPTHSPPCSSESQVFTGQYQSTLLSVNVILIGRVLGFLNFYCFAFQCSAQKPSLCQRFPCKFLISIFKIILIELSSAKMVLSLNFYSMLIILPISRLKFFS